MFRRFRPLTKIINLQKPSILYTLKTKTRKKNNFRSSTVMVIKMFFFWNQKCSLFEKMFFFQEQIMISTWKSYISDTFSVLDLNPNEKWNTFSKSLRFFRQKKSQLWNFCALLTQIWAVHFADFPFSCSRMKEWILFNNYCTC
jgi:hypothetical protein